MGEKSNLLYVIFAERGKGRNLLKSLFPHFYPIVPTWIFDNIDLSVRVPTSPFAAAAPGAIVTGVVSLETSSMLDKRPSPLRAVATTLAGAVMDCLEIFLIYYQLDMPIAFAFY